MFFKIVGRQGMLWILGQAKKDLFLFSFSIR